MIQKLPQFSFLDQLVQMIPEISTVLCGVPLILVVLAIKTLIAPQGVSCHLVWLFEERLIFNLLQNLKYRFSEHRINHLGTGRPQLPQQSPFKVGCYCIGLT